MMKLILAVAAISFLAVTTASACPYGYHRYCSNWAGGVSCSCIPN